MLARSSQDPPKCEVADAQRIDLPPIDLPPLLMIWTSPAFPAGAFAFSHGLEKLTEDGRHRDRASLEALLIDLVDQGTLRNDLILMAEAWRAAVARDQSRFSNVSALAVAMQPSAERHLESVTQGHSFFGAVSAAWPHALFDLHDPNEAIAYPIALTLAAAAHGLPLDAVLFAHCLGFVSNLISAAIRLSIIGQTDGQRTLAAMLPLLAPAVARARDQSLDDLGSGLYAVDLATLKHETQYSRLFRS